MKKVFFVIMIHLAVLNCAMGKGRGLVKKGIDKRYLIGPGFAVAVPSGTSYKFGGTARFDFLINDKLGAGIKYIYAPDLTKNYTNADGLTMKYRGHDFNVCANASYYIIGDNQKSQFGLYASLGAGYWNYTSSTFTIFSNGSTKRNTYYSKGLMGAVALGSSAKIGPGRIFLDATAVVNIKGKESTRIVETSPSLISEVITPLSFKFIKTAYLSVGYAFAF